MTSIDMDKYSDAELELEFDRLGSSAGEKDHPRERPGSCGPPAARGQLGTTGVLCVGTFARTD